MELKKPSWKSINKPSVWVSLFAIAALIPILVAPSEIQTSLTLKLRIFTIIFSAFLFLSELIAQYTIDRLNLIRILPKVVLCIYAVHFGPSILNDLYLVSKEHPETSTAFGLSVLGIVALNWMSNLLDRFLPSLQDLGWKNKKKLIEDQKTSEKHREPKPCTSKDIAVTCIHEAGHALVYAALPNIPDPFRMKALPQADGKGRLGFVSSVDWNGIFKPKDFLLFQLLVFLAGQQAEQCIFGEIFDGAHNDLRYCQEEAKNYLRLGFGEFYFTPTESDYEAEQNRQVLERLRNQQKALLSRFFKANQQVLQDLANDLQDKGKLLKDDVEPFLARVQIVDGFPRLSRDN